ncbi:MAG: hypothetical protein ACRYGR_00590 [Janthinobacterium lividum]
MPGRQLSKRSSQSYSEDSAETRVEGEKLTYHDIQDYVHDVEPLPDHFQEASNIFSDPSVSRIEYRTVRDARRDTGLEKEEVACEHTESLDDQLLEEHLVLVDKAEEDLVLVDKAPLKDGPTDDCKNTEMQDADILEQLCYLPPNASATRSKLSAGILVEENGVWQMRQCKVC